MACNECAFPICRTCYEYERREGSQVCPQCKTRFKRLQGCARVDGDEEEDNIDDLENEFKQQDFALVPVELVHDALPSQVLLLTDGSTVVSCSSLPFRISCESIRIHQTMGSFRLMISHMNNMLWSLHMVVLVKEFILILRLITAFQFQVSILLQILV